MCRYTPWVYTLHHRGGENTHERIKNFKVTKGDIYNCSEEKYNTPTTIELVAPDVDLNQLKDIAASVLVNVTFEIQED